jgi:hypothetical protein
MRFELRSFKTPDCSNTVNSIIFEIPVGMNRAYIAPIWIT